MQEDGVDCESFTIISIDFLLVYQNKYYLQVYLDNCVYKIVNTQMIHYLDDNLFESDKNLFLTLLNRSYKSYITMGFI